MAKVKSAAHLYLSLVGAAAPVATAITSITKATPPVVTPATMPPTLASGDFVTIKDTGEVMLDGFAFRIQNKTATTFELTLVDGTKFVAAIASKGTLQGYNLTGASAMLEACMAQITVTGQAPDTINLDDMCSASTLLGDAKVPTFTFSGFVDQAKPGFLNLVDASQTIPKPIVQVLIDYGTAAGYIAGPAQIGEITVTAGVNQGLQFSGSGVFTALPTYSWAL